MEKTSRHELHLILDQIPDEGLEEARRLLKELVVSIKRETPGLGIIDEYEYENEDLSEKELRALKEADESIKSGAGKPWIQVKEEIGL